MKQDSSKLLPGTVVVNENGEKGTLRILCSGWSGNWYWLVDWEGGGLSYIPLDVMQGYTLYPEGAE